MHHNKKWDFIEETPQKNRLIYYLIWASIQQWGCIQAHTISKFTICTICLGIYLNIFTPCFSKQILWSIYFIGNAQL